MPKRSALRSIKGDMRRNVEGADVVSRRFAALRVVPTVRWGAVVMFRLAQAAGRRVRFLGALLKQANHILTGADIAWEAQVGPGLVLFHPTGVVIGPRCVIGEDCTIQQGVTIGTSGKHPQLRDSPRIGDRCIIGAGARILGPIELGNDVVVGANAVVITDVPSGCTAVGIPARATPSR